MVATLEKDTTNGRDECLIEIYRKLRPGDPPTVESAETLLDGLFFDRRRYDISKSAAISSIRSSPSSLVSQALRWQCRSSIRAPARSSPTRARC